MREALGKGADAVLAAAAQCMEYGTRTCTYAELSAAWAAAENRQGEAWTAARTLGDEALRALSVWCSTGSAPPVAGPLPLRTDAGSGWYGAGGLPPWQRGVSTAGKPSDRPRPERHTHMLAAGRG